MIQLTRLKGQPITVNSDLIKFVESNPDTVITLVNGEKILVHETPDEIVKRVVEFRRAVIGDVLSGNADAGVAAAVMGSGHRDQGVPQPEERSRG